MIVGGETLEMLKKNHLVLNRIDFTMREEKIIC